MKHDFRLIGDRVMVEKYVTAQKTIVIPDMAQTMSSLGRVIAVGDGKRPGKPDIKMHVNVGDVVYFQTNAIMQANCCYASDQRLPYLHMMQSELIARINIKNPGDGATYETFEPLCDWVMLKAFAKNENNLIVTPDSIKEQFNIYFRVKKKGGTVDIPVSVGDEVVAVQGRCNPFQICGETYAYVHKDEIHGVVTE